MFNVICLDTGEPIKSPETGLALLYENGALAAAHARILTTDLGKKHQPRPCKDEAWQARELGRFADGTYTRLPWDVSYTTEDYSWHWFTKYRRPEALLHFPHVSKTHPGCIAFTQDATKGAADIQTPMKPGRYLKQFYLTSSDASDGLTERDIRRFANEFLSQFGTLKLQFANTPDEIEHVYVNGPNSCMSKSLSHYSSSVHPTRIYGAGDLAVAYLVTDDDGEHITARVLCWPSKLVYGRIYGDEDKLAAMLQAQGYEATDDYDMTGAKLLRIEERNGRIVCPYIDGNMSVEDHGTYLRIGGELSADCQDGYCQQQGAVCQSCEEHYDADSEGAFVNDVEESWCQSCCDNGTWHCEVTGEIYSNNETPIEMSDGSVWSQMAFDRSGFHCDGSGINYSSRRNSYVVLSGSCEGECWHVDYFGDHGFTCSDCGENFSDDDKHDISDADCPDDTCLDCAGKAGLKTNNQTELELETV